MPLKSETMGIAAVGVAILVGVLIFVPERWFYTDFQFAPRPEGAALSPNQLPDPDKDGITRETVKFACQTKSTVSVQEMCDGWLYTPNKHLSLQNMDKQFPMVIMAHGIGATKDQGLDAYAKAFAKNGMMVLVFDYLHFGLSDGYPRHKISPLQHVNDYSSAIQYAKDNMKVDTQRIALWGTSYAGGHVLVSAAKEKATVKAVISQMPFLGSMPGESPMDELKKRGIGNVVKGFAGALSSKLRRAVGMSAFYSRLYGHVGDNQPLALNYWEKIGATPKEWMGKHPKNRKNDWRNAILTESLLEMIAYKPIKSIGAIDTQKTKVMIVQAKHDKICPNNRMEYVINRLKCESQMVDATHYGVYTE
eukprot:352560_1